MTAVAPGHSGARRDRVLDRPVFVVAAPGVDTAPLVLALAAAEGRWALVAAGSDLVAHTPRLQPANRGWDTSRLGRQDARAAVLASLEESWRPLLVDPREPGRRAEGDGLRVVASYDDAALQVDFLRTAWPDATFVHLSADEDACRSVMEAAWASGTAVSQPDLPDWDGPAWSYPLIPGWRDLRGAPLADVVAAQWRAAAHLLRTDLDTLPEGCWTSVSTAELARDLPGVVERVGTLLRGTRRPGVPEPSPYRSVNTPSFPELLDKIGSTLLATTYQSGRLVVARTRGGRLNTHFRQFPSPMGMAYRDGMLALGTKGQVQTFTNLPGFAEGLTEDRRHDACFVPRATHFTGDIRIHDVAWAGDRLWAVATRFSCLVTLDERHSFVPQWRPSFISDLQPEDRCHLNGMAVVDDRVTYVTALGTTDVAGGWRERKADGGVVLDVASGEVVAGGLSMPHSPRWYRDQLWVLESGRGHLSRVDLATGRLDPVAELPGFTRGLAFAGRYAFVGLSEVREANTFGGLPLTARLEDRECGVWVVDIVTGQTAGYLRFQGAVQEIFDVTLLPGIRFPELLDAGSEAHLNAFVLPPPRQD